MHFSVLVISKTGKTKEVEGLLEPFFEHDHYQFDDKTEEIKEKWDKYDEKDKFDNNIENYAVQYFGASIENDKYGFWYNPNAKWDWFKIGGRWDNHLPIKTKEKLNVCKIKGFRFRT